MIIIQVNNGTYGYVLNQVQGEEMELPNVYYETFDEAYEVATQIMRIENDIIIEGEL